MMIPEIKKLNGIPTLMVDGEPFFALAGEIHNSSSSNLKFMEENVWPYFDGLHMNTVVVPIYWELIEPVEDEYHFEFIEGLIDQARSHGMRLVFLWFGLWKNSESMYVPGWMKRDTETYFRARKVNGEPINTISPLCSAAVKKDKKAFTEVMSFIKSKDEQENTVIVMQIENEIGLLGTERDYSDAANDAFSNDVPEEVAEHFGVTGDWKTAFGIDAEEQFMAYYFAKAVGEITDAGRAVYPLPCYTNAWLKQYPWYAGSYPSGGPVYEVHQMWKLMAPSLFTLGPDIYVSNVVEVMEQYAYEGNPLFIPEVRKDISTASYALYAFGGLNALCYSPFGIEELSMPADAIDKPPMEVMIALNIDPSAFEVEGSKPCLAKVYDFIDQVKPIYLKYRGTDALQCYVRKNDLDFGTFLRLSLIHI